LQFHLYLISSDENLLAFQAPKEEVRPRGTVDCPKGRRKSLFSRGNCDVVDGWLADLLDQDDVTEDSPHLEVSGKSGPTTKTTTTASERLEAVAKKFNKARKRMKLEFEGDEADWIEPGNLVCSVNESVILVRQSRRFRFFFSPDFPFIILFIIIFFWVELSSECCACPAYG
jgi:hypothetical protein